MGYVESGYVKPNYVEGTGTPQTPSDSIVSISRSYILDGVDISYYVNESEIIREVGKAFTVIDIKLSGYTIPTSFIRNKDKRLVVTIGTDTYSFILFDVDKDFKEDYSIIGKTQGCLLDYPFSLTINESYSGSGNDIMSTLASSIDYYINTPDFKFNDGSFVLNGSALDGIEKLLSVSGGTMYEVNNKLQIAERFSISSTTPNFIFNDDVLLSKDFSDNFSGSPLVQKITFNASSVIDIVSEPQITMVIEDNCSTPYFLLTPSPTNVSQIISNLGTLTLSYKSQIYDTRLTSANSLLVRGGIKSIDIITLDGVDINPSSYSFQDGQNAVLFDAVISGNIRVVYTTLAITSYSIQGVYDSIKHINLFEVQYLNQILQEEIAFCTDIVSDSNTNSCSIKHLNSMGRDIPLYFDVEGSVSQIAFISNPSAIPTVLEGGYLAYGSFDTSFILDITTQVGEVDRTLTAKIEDMTLNTPVLNEPSYGFIVKKGLTLSNIMIGSVELTLSLYTLNDNYDIYYTQSNIYLGLSATCTYQINVTRYRIPPCELTNDVKFVDFYMCDNIYSFEYEQGEVCIIPANITIDFASLLSVDPALASGKIVSFDGTNYTVEANGSIEVYISTLEYFTIDTAVISKGSEVYVDTTNAGTLAEYEANIVLVQIRV